MKIGKLFENVLNEASDEERIDKLMAPLTIENGDIKLWHYSGTDIPDDFISIRGKQGLHSKSEFRSWGQSRAFFYGTEDGILHDTGVPNKFMYISHIPVDEVYPVMINPRGYEVGKGEHRWQSLYEQAKKDGYNAFIYNLGGKEGVPIIVSFVNLPIDEAYGRTKGGGWRSLDFKEMDYKVGEFVDEKDQKWNIMQKDGFKRTLTNTYLSLEDDPKEAMKSYKKPFYDYQWKDADIDQEYIADYAEDFK